MRQIGQGSAREANPDVRLRPDELQLSVVCEAAQSQTAVKVYEAKQSMVTSRCRLEYSDWHELQF